MFPYPSNKEQKSKIKRRKHTQSDNRQAYIQDTLNTSTKSSNAYPSTSFYPKCNLCRMKIKVEILLILSYGTNTCVDNMHILFDLLCLVFLSLSLWCTGGKTNGENEEDFMQKNVKG